VATKPPQRTYTAEDERRILKEADACTTPGPIGATLRREGRYSRIWWWDQVFLWGRPDSACLIRLDNFRAIGHAASSAMLDHPWAYGGIGAA
jgi:hypothetical protein